MAARDSSFNSDRQFVSANLAVSVEMTAQEYDAAVKSLIPHILAYFIDDCTFFIGTPYGPDVVVTVKVARVDAKKKKHEAYIGIRPHGNHEIEWDSDQEFNKWRYLSYRTIMERVSENGNKAPLSESSKVINGLIDKIKNPDKVKEIGKPTQRGDIANITVPSLMTIVKIGGIGVRFNRGTPAEDGIVVHESLPEPEGSAPPAEQPNTAVLAEADEICAFVDGYQNTDGVSPTDYVDGAWPGYLVFTNQTPELENRWIELDTSSDVPDVTEIATFLNDVIKDWPLLPEGCADMQWTFAFWDQDGEDRELIGKALSHDQKIKFYWSAHSDCIYLKPINTGRVLPASN